MVDIAVTVRPVQLSDAADVQDNCFTMNTLEEVQSHIRANLQASEEEKGLQLVAEVDGKAVGTVILTRNSHPLFTHRAELGSLVVHGDYQRRGIARRLVEESRSYAQSMGIEILEISCRAGTPAEQVYPRLGFIEYGRLPQGIKEPWGDHNAFDIVYFYQPLEGTSDDGSTSVASAVS